MDDINLIKLEKNFISLLKKCYKRHAVLYKENTLLESGS